MRTYDLTPLFRSTVGFDRLARLMDSASQVAGFSENDLEITVQENSLLISGRIEDREETAEKSYLHRGIAARAFERRFDLADDIKVVAADVKNGLLSVDLVRVVPEEKKPRRVEIGSGAPKALEKQAA